MNARALQRAAGVEVIYEETVLQDGHIVEMVDGERLARKVLELLDEPERLDEIGKRSREFFPHDALARIRAFVEMGKPERRASRAAHPAHERTPGVEGERLNEPFPGNTALLGLLEKEAARAGLDFTPASVLPDARDLDYAASRATALLASESWEARNLGVKLLGLLHAREKVPFLLTLLRDRTPAPLLERLLGGDFVQVGFIRRNILIALSRLGDVTPDVEEALLLSLTDPYYEARAEAARTTAALGCRLTRKTDFVPALAALLFDPNFEVACASAEGLGAVGGEADALPPLLALKHAKLWKLRAAGLRGILALVERGAIGDVTRLQAELPGFALTSTDFRPHFEIKAAYGRLTAALEKR